MIMIAPLPGITATKPGSARGRFPALSPRWWTTRARGRSGRGGGYLVLSKPWPAMLRTIYGDPDRYVEQYWSRSPGMYFTGDGCKMDGDGYFWLLGRVDDVMNVSGHRISTMKWKVALVDASVGGGSGGDWRPHE